LPEPVARFNPDKFLLQVACRPVEETIFRQNKAFEVHQNFCRKPMPKDFANCKPAAFAILQVASIHRHSISVKMPQVLVLEWNCKLNRSGTMPAKRKTSGERL
jgi:hypothetical protein